jgi:1-acyl-sn-glycerol-3-phosphate acyltransferase
MAKAELLGMFPQGTCLTYRLRPWHRGAAKLALASGVPIVPVAIIGSERALRPGKPKLGLPRIRLHGGEAILVERDHATIAAAKQLTARIEQAVEELRATYGRPSHAWFETTPAG